MIPASQPSSSRPYARPHGLIIAITVFSLGLGFVALRFLESRLLAATGEQLALAASDIAEKLDLLLYERYGDIQVMARTAAIRMRDLPALSHELQVFQQVYPVYAWLAVADAKGRIVAATDRVSVGQDRSGSGWFRAIREQGGVQVHDAQTWEETGGVRAVAFSAPIMSSDGAFLGVVTSRVGVPVLAEYFARTVQALQIQRAASGTIEWQFLTAEGKLLVDSVLHQEEADLNLREMGLPSASIKDSQPGYVAEQHLRRQVPVLTGYARTNGYREFPGLRWWVLLRMDQSEVLVPIRTVLWKLGAVGALIVAPLLGLLLWSTRRMTETNRALATEVAERTTTEQRFRLVFESAPYGMIMVNQAGSIQLVNTQAEQLFGFTREELLGQPIELLVPEASRPSHVTDRLLFQASPRTRSMGAGRDLRARRKDGVEVPVEIALVPLYMHDVPVVLATIVDISARKRAELAERTRTEQLVRQHEALVTLSRMNMPDVGTALRILTETGAQTLSVDRVSVWLFTSDRSEIVCEHLYRLNTREHEQGHRLQAGQYPRYFSAVQESRVLSASDARTDPRTSEFTGHYLVPLGITSMLDAAIRRHGEVIGVVCHEHTGPARVWTSEEQDFAAAVADLVALLYEEFELEQAEEALRTAQAQLLEQHRHEKEHVEAELARTRDVLVRQTRLAAIGELAAGIAHDLRNPLGAIRNACHLIKRRVPAEDRKGVEYVRIVEEEVTASDRIISNLLEIARGKLPSKASVSLASVVEKAFQQARPASTIRRRLAFDPDPFMVWGDPTQLQQVLHNLILNAAQAMGTGGEIRITARHAGGDDEILVADDGPGIPAAKRAQVFEPLFTTKADGTGLGLTICRQLIERHGGSIGLLANEPPGATFAIRLPRRQEAGVYVEMASTVNRPSSIVGLPPPGDG
jgi:PAS domain S-box-containing protein